MTRLAIGGTYNLRDVGGRPTAGGGVIRGGRLFRSDSLHALTPAGAAALADLGIRTIIDLRSVNEVGRAPNSIEGLSIHELRLPLFDVAEPAVQIDLSAGLEGMYGDLVATAGPTLVRVAREIATAEGPVLVHCTAGKDRTGLAIAVVLDAVGVARDAIIDDFALSEANLAGEWADLYIAHLTKDVSIGAAELIRFMTASPRELLAQVLSKLDDDYGGAAGYLSHHGFPNSDQELLERRLVEHRPQPHREGETR
jgi:protein-tyrosine phosphatase